MALHPAEIERLLAAPDPVSLVPVAGPKYCLCLVNSVLIPKNTRQMIHRQIERTLILRKLVVALLGLRQVGKTTLARDLELGKPIHYLDLERPSDLAKLADPELYLGEFADHLVVWMRSSVCPMSFPFSAA